MPKHLPLTAALVGLACLPAWAGAATPALTTFHEVNVLGTSLDLVVNAPARADAEKARDAVLAEIERLRRQLSTYDNAADLARVNASTDPVRVGPDVIAVLHLYERWAKDTHGALSGGVGRLVALWKDAAQAGKAPDAAALAPLLPPDKLWEIDAAAGTVRRLGSVQINVDSLGKGFIVSAAARRAMKDVPAVEGLLLNVGGDITALGSAEPGRKTRWTVPVANPRAAADNAPPLTTVRLTDMAIATSGAYARNYTVGGHTFSHLIDARTGMPADVSAPKRRQVVAATALAPDNATANALAAALCLLPAAEGLDLVGQVKDAGCLLVLGDGTVLRSDGFRQVEAARTTAAGPLEQSAIAEEDGPRWPQGYTLSFPLQLQPAGGRASERPYIAIWVEDAFQQHVSTLAVWGNDRRWLPSMSGWWRFGQNVGRQLASITRATRPAGKYQFSWDGRDQNGKPVPAGTYTVWIETSFEHGGHVLRSVTVRCGDAPATASLPASPHYDALTLSYNRGKN
jgi:thiamine biosynthesis lipoprotein ApbE